MRSSDGPFLGQRAASSHAVEPYSRANRVKVPPLRLLNKNSLVMHAGPGVVNHLGGQKRVLEDLAKNLGSLQSADKSVVESWKESGHKQMAMALD